MVAQFIAMRPILDLCEKAVRRPGARVPRWWWEQTGIDWKGAREKAEAAEEAVEPALKDTESESEADAHTTDGTARGTGEEASLGASGSSGAGRRTNSSNSIGRGPKAGTNVAIFKPKRDRV